MIEEIPQTELDVYKEQFSVAEKFSTTLEIKTEDDYQKAFAEGKSIKDKLEIVKTREKYILEPYKEAMDRVKELFAPFKLRATTAIDTIKAKMTSFTDEKERKAAIKIEKIYDKVEAGKMSEGVASAKIFMATPAKTVVTEAGRATVKKLKKYYVVDKSLVPLQFMDVDLVKVKASYAAGTPVPGTEERLESNTSFS